MSDDTARAIDAEIKSIIDRNYERAEKILTENRDVLETMKDCLMKYETIDAKQIDDLMARIEPRPPADWVRDNKDDSDNTSGGATVTDVDKKDTKPVEPNVGKPGDATS
ncbi:MAG: ATP-dependent metalloprotease, partial [Sinobacterium sp.]